MTTRIGPSRTSTLAFEHAYDACMELQLDDELWAWITTRAGQLFHGDIGKTIVHLLREQHAYEMYLLSGVNVRSSMRTESDAWSHLSAKGQA